MPASTERFLSRRLHSTAAKGTPLTLELGHDVKDVPLGLLPVDVPELRALPVALDLLLDARPQHEEVVGLLVGLDQAGLGEAAELLGGLVGVSFRKLVAAPPVLDGVETPELGLQDRTEEHLARRAAPHPERLIG
jgi:hypothetical protein